MCKKHGAKACKMRTSGLFFVTLQRILFSYQTAFLS